MPSKRRSSTGAEELARAVEASDTLVDLEKRLRNMERITIELEDGTTNTTILLGVIDNLIDKAQADESISYQEATKRGLFNSIPTKEDNSYNFASHIADLYDNTTKMDSR